MMNVILIGPDKEKHSISIIPDQRLNFKLDFIYLGLAYLQSKGELTPHSNPSRIPCR